MPVNCCFPNTFPIVTFLLQRGKKLLKNERSLSIENLYCLAFGKSGSIKRKMMRFGLSECAYGRISVLSFAVCALFVGF